jgi:hypothetical protein
MKQINNMKRKTIILLFLLISIFIIQSCSHKKKAKGPEDEIHVISDSLEYILVEEALKETFGKIIHTPQPEELFHLKRHSINNLNQLKQKKNIILLAPLNSGSYTSKYLESLLDSTVNKMISEDSVFVINKHDLWAEDQLVMILSAKNIDQLRSKIIEKKEDLFYYFRDKSNKRLAKGLYNPRFEQKNIEAKFLNNYGWMMYIQADYQLALEKPEDNFVWLRRGINSDMERWIFVHWIENSSPEFLEVDSITTIRNRLTQKYYRTADDTAYVELYDDFRINSEVNFNGRYALMTQGLWRFNDKSMGGPFICYTFYDENTGRIYMLDASILAPKYFKKSLLQQVDVLLHSFKTEDEIDPIRKKEILEELEE